jgi:hypothetical protein
LNFSVHFASPNSPQSIFPSIQFNHIHNSSIICLVFSKFNWIKPRSNWRVLLVVG